MQNGSNDPNSGGGSTTPSIFGGTPTSAPLRTSKLPHRSFSIVSVHPEGGVFGGGGNAFSAATTAPPTIQSSTTFNLGGGFGATGGSVLAGGTGSSPAFGAFGGASTPAFGNFASMSTTATSNPQSSPQFGFGSASAFGGTSNTTGGIFGSQPQPPASTPPFGVNAFGTQSSSPAFGSQSSGPIFGSQSATAGFGASTSTPAFPTQSNVPFATLASTPSFGVQATSAAFGSTIQTHSAFEAQGPSARLWGGPFREASTGQPIFSPSVFTAPAQPASGTSFGNQTATAPPVASGGPGFGATSTAPVPATTTPPVNAFGGGGFTMSSSSFMSSSSSAFGFGAAAPQAGSAQTMPTFSFGSPTGQSSMSTAPLFGPTVQTTMTGGISAPTTSPAARPPANVTGTGGSGFLWNATSTAAAQPRPAAPAARPGVPTAPISGIRPDVQAAASAPLPTAANQQVPAVTTAPPTAPPLASEIQPETATTTPPSTPSVPSAPSATVPATPETNLMSTAAPAAPQTTTLGTPMSQSTPPPAAPSAPVAPVRGPEIGAILHDALPKGHKMQENFAFIADRLAERDLLIMNRGKELQKLADEYREVVARQKYAEHEMQALEAMNIHVLQSAEKILEKLEPQGSSRATSSISACEDTYANLIEMDNTLTELEETVERVFSERLAPIRAASADAPTLLDAEELMVQLKDLEQRRQSLEDMV